MSADRSRWPDWLREADISDDAQITINSDGQVVWKGGIWEYGLWLGGTWVEGMLWPDDDDAIYSTTPPQSRESKR